MKKLLFFIIATALFAITPKEYQAKLGLGIDVNWATFNWIIKNKYYKKADVFKQLGFNTIRIRFKDPNDLRRKISKKAYYEHLKACVDEALKNNLVPVLSYSYKKLLNNPTNKNISHAVHTWKEVAAIFKNYPDLLSFDLLTEPGKKIKRHPKALVRFYKRAIKQIRKTNPSRIIFIAPTHASNPYYLNILKPIVKHHPKNIMIEWHYYAAGPSLRNKHKLWTVGTDYEKSLIDKKARYAKEWCEKYGLYSWVGALMPGDYNKGDHYTYDQQKNFMKAVIDTQNRYDIPFAINADTQFYDYRSGAYKREDVLKYIINYYYFTKK